MNLFEIVKSAVTVKQAAEHYGFEVNQGDREAVELADVLGYDLVWQKRRD